MGGLPSFNYDAINAPGGIAAGLGGLTSALIQGRSDARRMALTEQQMAERRSEGEMDRLMRQQQMDDIRASRAANAEREGAEFEHRKMNDQRNFELADRNSMSLGAARLGNAVNDFQRGGGLMGMFAGPPKAGRAPLPNDDVMPANVRGPIDERLETEWKVEDERAKAENPEGLFGAMQPGVIRPVRKGGFDTATTRKLARSKAYEAAGYDSTTMRRLGAGTVNAAGQSSSPQTPPTPSDQPSAAPNLQAPGESDADILELKKQHPQYATIPDDEFVRRVRAKRQAKAP